LRARRTERPLSELRRLPGLPAIPDQAAALIRAFKHGVSDGLSEVPKATGRKQRPRRDLPECLRDAFPRRAVRAGGPVPAHTSGSGGCTVDVLLVRGEH
jgi:hypothetical protein